MFNDLDKLLKTVNGKGKDVRNPNRFMILGAKFDGMALSMDEIVAIRRAYPKGVSSIHAQLVGLLEMSKRSVADAIETPAKSLAMILDQRSRDLKEN